LIASMIYNMKYRNSDHISPHEELDWAANFAHMIGRNWDKHYQELCRLFFILHSDQGIGNVSGHTAILVSSAHSDIFYACSAAMNGLAGPLHGRANQDCLKWILEIRNQFGCCPSKSEMEGYIWDYLRRGKRIPGYGHPVIRTTDPRFTLQLEFGQKYMPEDELFRIVEMVYETAPNVLREHSKVKNPYPNIDAVSGSLQYHCGVKEFDFYPVLFGMGRVLGITANLVWARALNMPLERPQSITLEMVERKARGL
jgi:citrate synthase